MSVISIPYCYYYY